ncbi:MAG: GtrA family protein [Gallionella sp.]
MDEAGTSQRQRTIFQLLRYGLVGVLTNLAMYLLYLLITYIGVEPKQVMTGLYVVGALIGFVGHRNWTFTHEGAMIGSGARYFIAHIFGYSINYLLLFTFSDKLGYPHQWVQASAIIIVALFLFVTFRYFVFPKT